MQRGAKRFGLWGAVVVWGLVGLAPAQSPITRPSISEEISPVEELSVVTVSGQKAIGVARKPPGPGPFPAVVIIHGGLEPYPSSILRAQALNGVTMTRFLAAGYVTVIPTYRSRSRDPEAPDAILDLLAIIEEIRGRPYVDGKSIVIYGCSGGADLALELAGMADLAAIVAEEPPGILFTGMFNNDTPKAGARYTASDVMPLLIDPERASYTPEVRKTTEEKIERIGCPVLIAQGDQPFRIGGYEADQNVITNEILIPELQAAGKEVEVVLYPGQYHCFGMDRRFNAADHVDAAMKKFFSDMHSFFVKRLATRPEPLEESLVEKVALGN